MKRYKAEPQPPISKVISNLTDHRLAKKPPPMPDVHRSSTGLRAALFDEIDRLRNGKTNQATANAMARLAGSIIQTVQLEIEAERVLSKRPPSIDDENLRALNLAQPVRLTTDDDDDDGAESENGSDS